jgi:hypothetical protein
VVAEFLPQVVGPTVLMGRDEVKRFERVLMGFIKMLER